MECVVLPDISGRTGRTNHPSLKSSSQARCGNCKQFQNGRERSEYESLSYPMGR